MSETIKSISSVMKDIYENNDILSFKSMYKNSALQKAFANFLEDAREGKVLISEKADDLKWLLKLCNRVYNQYGEDTGLSDSDYDALVEYYRDQTGKDILTEKEVGDTTSHLYPTLRGTLDKVYKMTEEDVLKNPSQKTLSDWVARTESRYQKSTGKTINLWEEEIIAMPKFDGVSVVFECDEDGSLLRALTRGNTETNEAQDVTSIFKDRFTSPVTSLHRKHGVKTEVLMLDQDLVTLKEKYGITYKNTRNATAGILNPNSDSHMDKKDIPLQIVPLRYSYLLENGEESLQELPSSVYDYPYLICKLKDVELIHDFALAHKYVHPGLRCDGCVIRLTNPEVQKALGRENHRQKFEVAFKYTEEVTYSKVKDVEYTVGLMGRITPVVRFEPVILKGNEVKKASLGSYRRFKELGLHKNDVIKVMYDIVPYVDFVEDDENCVRSDKKKIKVPSVCPECGEDLSLSDTKENLYCMNPKCPGRKKGKILNYCQKMDIGFISFSTIEDLWNHDFLKEIPDLYRLEENRSAIEELEGFGKLRFDRLLEELDKHMEVMPSTFLGSLGIEGVSKKKFQSLLQHFTLGEILTYSLDKNYEFFTVVPGIKQKTSQKIVDGIIENHSTIEELLNILTITKEFRGSGAFIVVFTKVRDKSLEKFIEDHEGRVADSVTKDTSFVVVPIADVKSSKTEKAKEYGIPIIPLENVRMYITENF